MDSNELFGSPAEIRHRIGAAGSFSLNNISGDVRIRGTDGDEVVVRARWDHGGGDRPLPLVVRRTDSSLSIDTEERGGWFGSWNRGSIEFDVTVPSGARVEIQAVSADIESHKLIGDQSYRTVSGDVVIDGSGGHIAAVSVSGDIDITAVEMAEVNATTTSGDIEAHAKAFDPLRLKTVSGDMEVRGGFTAGPQHTVESVSGDLSIEAFSGLTVDTKRGLDFTSKKNQAPIVTGDGAARLRFRSLSGDVRLSGGASRATNLGPNPPRPPAAPEAPFEARPPASPEMTQEDSLEILRALERGEIDVEEASRRLGGAGTNA
jgi:hypothetical protein